MATRTAIIYNASPSQVEPYLPGNYEVLGTVPNISNGGSHVIIQGEDHLGWTLDSYVLPRLASGLYFGEEVKR